MQRSVIFTAWVLAACFAGCSREETVEMPNAPAAESSAHNTDADPEFLIDNDRENTSVGPFSEWPSLDSTGGIQLRYRFVPGQRIDYIMRNEIDNDIVNSNYQTKMNLDFYFHVTVDVVEADGSAVITQSIDRFTFKLKGSDGTIIYDSADGEESDHPQWKELRQEFLPMQSAHCTYRVTPSGVVSDVQPALPSFGGSQDKLEPSMLAGRTQDQLEQNAMALFHPMPEGAVEPGATWNYTRNVDVDNLKFEYVFTKIFRGTEGHEGRQVVDITGTVVTKKTGKVTPAFEYNVDDELPSWQEYFDPKLGWLVSMNEVTGRSTKQNIMGVDVETNTSTKMSIQLQLAVDTRPRMPLRVK